VGCPPAAARAPVLCGVRSRGRVCGRETPLPGSSPRARVRRRARVAPARIVHRGRIASWVPRDACGLPASLAVRDRAQWSAALGRRGGSSTLPTAARAPRGSLVRSGEREGRAHRDSVGGVAQRFAERLRQSFASAPVEPQQRDVGRKPHASHRCLRGLGSRDALRTPC